MIDYYTTLLQKHSQTGILPDTNILLLYFVGVLDVNLINRFKRTVNKFSIEDYYLLYNLLNNFQAMVTTPNILTEVSNLAGQLNDPAKSQFFTLLARSITLLKEHYIPSTDTAQTPAFIKFGITDAGIAQIKPYLVLTEDFALAQYLQSQNIDAINFNHIRVLN